LAFAAQEFGGIEHALVYRIQREVQTPVKTANAASLPSDAPKEFAALSEAFWKSCDYDTAIAVAKRAIEIDPNYARAYSYLGMALKEKGERDAALEAFRKAVQLNPTDYLWTYTNIGSLLTEKGECDAALAALARALEMDPKYAWGYTCVGKANLAKGDYDAAIAAFQKSIELDPNDARSRDGLKEAEQRKAGGAAPPPPSPAVAPARSEPRTPASPEVAALVEQGKTHLAGGAYDAALTTFQKAIELDKNNPDLYGYVGTALLGKGDENGALMSFRKFMQLSPENAQRFGPLIKAVFETKDFPAAQAELKRLEAAGVEVPKEMASKIRGMAR
jgi:tetratricopeptide (TPR) repeat protein